MKGEISGMALRLHGPLQAWGGPVVGDNRPTLMFPTRSGVLGIIGACLGVARTDQPRLIKLATGARVHVRVDAPGTPMVDDQTIQGHPAASTTRQTIQSKRTYLCNASFVAVVVPGSDSDLREWVEAVRQPVFTPFLGRRSCVPSSPLLLSPLVEAHDAMGLFDGLPHGPPEITGAIREVDFYLDETPHPNAMRNFRVRDELAGAIPRQWGERRVFHVRRSTGISTENA